MGCAQSSEEFPFSSLNPLVTDTQTFPKKVKALEAIKKNDTFLVEKILQEVQPTENLGSPNQNYTCLHAAAELNSFQAMNLLISDLQEKRPTDILAIFEIMDSKGHNPVEKAIVSDSTETFYAILNNHVINLKDKKKREGLDWLCNEFSKDCLRVLEKYEKEQGIEEPSKNISITPKTDQRKIAGLEQRVQKVSAVSNKKAPSTSSGNAALKGIPQTSKVYQLIVELSKKNDHFRDAQFPLTTKSITTDSDHEDYADFSKAVWKRPNELFSAEFSDIKLFDTIDPNDIHQGSLGVCYFLCSISSLAEFPSRLSKVFVNQNANQYGAYSLKFYVKGVPTEIVVDDYIPCFGDRKRLTPLFAKPEGNELWVLLAEKAWGKLYKNYVAAEAGRPEDALEYLTGAPAKYHDTTAETADEIFKNFLNADKKKYIMCASTNDTASKSVGLVANHAYSLISAHQVGKHRILKLRNPWGHLEWNGAFSDNSKLWTEALKKAVGFTNEDDGIFCMTPEDFQKYFDSYAICYYNEGWEYTYVESQSDANHAEYFKFSVEDPCDIYLRIHQEDKRFYESVGKEYKYCPADLIVVKVEDDGSYTPTVTESDELHKGFKFGRRSTYPTEDMKLSLEPGQYIVRTKVRWAKGTRGKYTLSAYAPEKITLQKTAPVKGFLRKFFQSLGADLDTKDVGNDCSYASAYYGPYYYTYWDNNHNTKSWALDLTYTKLENLRIDSTLSTGANTLKMVIPSGESAVSILKKIDLPKATSSNFTWKSQWK